MGDINALIQDLAHPRAGTRLKAARGLTREPDPAALIPLLKSLGDEDPRVREAAGRALGKLGAMAVQPLRDVMKNGDPRVYRRALDVLSTIDDVSAAYAIIETVSEMDPYYVPFGQVAEAVVRIGDGAAVPICALLRHREYLFRELAADVLARIAAENPGPGLRAALPALRQRLLHIMELPHIRDKTRNAIAAIEAATTDMCTLPLAAGPPEDAPGVLPIPSKLPKS